MQNSYFTVSVTLRLQAPILTQVAGARSQGLDSAMWSYRGVPALPGTLVKGVARHVLEYFSCLGKNHKLSNSIDNWFGCKSGKNSNANHGASADYDPCRGRANFDYAFVVQNNKTPLCKKNHDAQDVRTRITINSATGAVEPGSIQTIDSPFALGEEVEFTGKVQLYAQEAEEVKRFRTWLESALNYLPALGAMKGAGFGKVLSCKCIYDEKQTGAGRRPSFKDEADCFQMQLHLDRPFCISARPLNDTNRFETLEFIPGNVIKGAIAESLRQGSIQKIGFDFWRICHAHVRQKCDEHYDEERPAVLPKSLVMLGKEVYDLALLSARKPESCFLIDDKAPKFQTDWKESDWALAGKETTMPIVDVDKELSLHTAIVSGKNYAKDNGLFSQEEVLPFNRNGELIWCTTLDISALTDEQKHEARTALNNIEKMGIANIGRTKANADVTMVAKPERVNQELEKAANNKIDGFELDNNKEELFYVVTLQSDALLLPEKLPHIRDKNQLIQATNDGKSLEALYRDYWQTQCDGLQLVSYFATQRQMGGNYYHHHYRRKGNMQAEYQTDWLTEAGSVFVLKIGFCQKTEIEKKMDAWLKQGLPVHSNYGDRNWESTPYLPQHGYGAVLINQPCHKSLAPPDSAVKFFVGEK